MPTQTRMVSPGPADRTDRAGSGEILHAPDDWMLLPPAQMPRPKIFRPRFSWMVQVGPAAFTRRVRAASHRQKSSSKRATPKYAKQREAGARRRERQQAEYVEDFHGAVLEFLAFHPQYAELAGRLAKAVTEHATPLGSGTVARTKRIPIDRRAEAAVIAWLRHATTGYDGMVIPRIKGRRRYVRRMLAEQSRELLQTYREGAAVDGRCPLMNALG